MESVRRIKTDGKWGSIERANSLEKTLMLGKIEHLLNGHASEQTPGDGEGQGNLACCSPWGRKELDTTERLNNKAWKILPRSMSLPPLDTWRAGSYPCLSAQSLIPDQQSRSKLTVRWFQHFWVKNWNSWAGTSNCPGYLPPRSGGGEKFSLFVILRNFAKFLSKKVTVSVSASNSSPEEFILPPKVPRVHRVGFWINSGWLNTHCEKD